MKTVDRSQSFVKAAQALFFLNTIIWIVFGVVSLFRMSNADANHRVSAVIIAILMFGNAAAMLVGGLVLGLRSKWLYMLAVAVIVVNIILTFTDQFGLLDFLTLVIDVILFGFLIAIRGRYLHATKYKNELPVS